MVVDHVTRAVELFDIGPFVVAQLKRMRCERLLELRGLEGVVVLRSPTTADIGLFLRLLRTGNPAGLDGLTTMRVVFSPTGGQGVVRPANPLEAWKRVVSGIAFKRSVIEGQEINENEARRVVGILLVIVGLYTITSTFLYFQQATLAETRIRVSGLRERIASL